MTRGPAVRRRRGGRGPSLPYAALTGGGGGGGGFVPSDLAGLRAWFDASDADSFTYSSGTIVSQWNDLSGNGYHVSQGNTSKQPTRDTTVNSLDAVTFDGTSDLLEHAGAQIVNATTGEWTAFAVVVTDTVSGVRSAFDSDDSNRVAQFLRMNGTAAEAIAFSTTASTATDTQSTLATATTYVLTSRADATTIQVWIDGASDGSTSHSLTLEPGTDNIGVGARAANTSFWDGVICEIVAYDTALAAGDRVDVQDYLTAKWAP